MGILFIIGLSFGMGIFFIIGFSPSVGNAFIRSALGNMISFLFPEAEQIKQFPTDGRNG